mmetsp:Transcript_120246/g.383886  ORF Transcript_120246/g.383886 Transcript_120246/m.383886 type:complete len:104 (-) Transcript_120246:300-611(-)
MLPLMLPEWNHPEELEALLKLLPIAWRSGPVEGAGSGRFRRDDEGANMGSFSNSSSASGDAQRRLPSDLRRGTTFGNVVEESDVNGGNSGAHMSSNGSTVGIL